MKGLKEYIEKHGRHFTENLAWDIGRHKWSVPELKRTVGDKVYYNVTTSTIGDILYLIIARSKENKRTSIKKALDIVGDYKYYDGVIFLEWLDDILVHHDEFDFTPYI